MTSTEIIRLMREVFTRAGIKEQLTGPELACLNDFAAFYDARVLLPERRAFAITKFIFDETHHKDAGKAAEKIVALLRAEDNSFDEPKEIEDLLQVYSPKATPPTEEEKAHLRAFCKSYVRRVTKITRQQALVTGELYDSELQFAFPLGMSPTAGEIIVRIYNSTK